MAPACRAISVEKYQQMYINKIPDLVSSNGRSTEVKNRSAGEGGPHLTRVAPRFFRGHP